MRSSVMPTIARVHVLLPGDEAERFSIYCSRNGFKKSTLIARLVREYLEREDTTEAPRRKSKASRKPRET